MYPRINLLEAGNKYQPSKDTSDTIGIRNT